MWMKIGGRYSQRVLNHAKKMIMNNFRNKSSPIKSNLKGPKEKAKNIFACPQKKFKKCDGKKKY
jgi:hypothetical protein